MRILVIGGTRLVGRGIVEAAIEGGHDVTLFNRGTTDPDAFPTATHLVGDRNNDLSALATGEWNVTVDVSAYVHQQVISLGEALGTRAGRHVFVSTISVYGNDVPESGFTESAHLLEPDWDQTLTMAKYGELKVACEQTITRFDPDPLIIRPGYVVGPWDYTERFTHWVRAVLAGSPFVAPAADQPLQCVDGRDLGAFTVHAIESSLTGAFNVTAPQDPPTFSEVIATIANSLSVEVPKVTWGDPSDESEELPLSASKDWWPKMRADLTKAIDAGFTYRTLDDTVRDLAAWADLS
jgi:2'-hydroxyisoflavone reductase